MNELVDELRRRFPLFKRIVGHFGDDCEQENIPWFFALLAAAATNDDTGACCFVLPKTPLTTPLVAVLCMLSRLFARSEALIREYAHTAVPMGSRVKVRPSKYVYEYGGIWENHERFFKLLKLDDPTSIRSFRVSDLLRLEPTDRIRPRGDTNSPIGQIDRTPLDRILDLTTCGNNAWMENGVLLHMPQARFGEILNSASIAPLPSSEFAPLSAYVPWGPIGHVGELLRRDPQQITGEPPLAVTRVPQDLAQAAMAAPCGSKTVLVDSARAAAREPQVFEEISDQQRVVIIASPEEADAIRILKDRGCPIWYMSGDELQLGETTGKHRSKDSLVGRTVENARIQQHLTMSTISCRDDKIEAIATALRQAAVAVDRADESREGEEIVARLYGILCESSECCFGVHSDIVHGLSTVRDLLEQHGPWLGPEVVQPVRVAVDGLTGLVDQVSSGAEKADALMQIIDEAHRRRAVWAIAARSPRTAEHFREWLKDEPYVRVLPIPAINVNDSFDGVIVPAWPNGLRFSKLLSLAVTSNMRVIVYPFELGWLRTHRARDAARRQSNRVDRDTRASILDIDRDLLVESEQRPLAPEQDRHEDPIVIVEHRVARRRVRPRLASEDEESREAQVVHFVGNCHALLTRWAKLPVLNQLLGTDHGLGRKIEYTLGNRLAPGDFVLFRSGSDKEFTRLIAEEILGEAKYNRIRGVAERWRPALRRIGSDPSFVRRRLEEYGISRTKATVSRWLTDPDQIAPSHSADIDIIARVAGDGALLRSISESTDAITRIRGAHVRAGNQLTDLILDELRGRIDQVGEEPLLLRLAYGDAWVVQVDSLGQQRAYYPAGSVNRLLSADGAVT